MVATPPLLIKGGRLLDPSQGLDEVGDALLRDGKVVHAGAPLEAAPDGAAVVEAAGLVVCPGFIDLHCHLREPGFEHKETVVTGTLAAAKGGFTTVCCMPNTEPAIDSASVVGFIQRKAAAEAAVRVLVIGAVTRGRLGKELADLGELAEAGVIGVSDDGAPVANAALMKSALLYLKPFGLPVIDHCEDPALSRGGVMNEGPVASRLGLRGVPAAAEENMVARNIHLAELTGGWVHLAHLSTAGSVAMVRAAKDRGLPVTAEVMPHHLTLTDEWVLGRQGQGVVNDPLTTGAYDTSAKVNPPLRSSADVDALIDGLKDGVIDIVATDHAPHAAVDKAVTYDEAAFGISNIETALGSLMSLARDGRIDLATLVRRMTSAPANLLGKAGEGLGALRAGAEGDVVVLDPNATWAVDAQAFVSKGKNSPLHGVTLEGRVVATVFGGNVVYREGA